MKAFDNFDYEKGFKTISYSVWWIKQSILEALKERNSIPSDDLPEDYEKQFDEDEVNTPITADEFIEKDSSEYNKASQIKESISLLMGCLNKREKIVISDYFGLDNKKEKTLEEIGNDLNLTKERVRQIKEKSLKKLRSEALANSINSAIYF